MAEACRLRRVNIENKSNSQDENYCVFNVMCVFISLVTILADLTTGVFKLFFNLILKRLVIKSVIFVFLFSDIIVFAEYCKDYHLYWALATIIFILIPNILINIFSIRWFIIDEKANISHWATHVCLVGLLQR